MLWHPLNTINDMGNALIHLDQTYYAFNNLANNYVGSVRNGDWEKFAYQTGNILGVLAGGEAAGGAAKGLSQAGRAAWAARAANVADDAFVHVTTPKGAQNILSGGLNPEISGFVTKWKYIKNVTNPSDFNTILYKQDLWPQMVGKFDNGFNILKIDATPSFYSPRTNWINGIPQYKFDTLIDPSLIELIK